MDHLLNELREHKKYIASKVDSIKQQYFEKGYYIEERLFSTDFCEYIKAKIDGFEDELEVSGKTMVDKEYGYDGSEMRIWNSEKRDPVLKLYNEICDEIGTLIFEKEMKAYNLLSIRNRPLTEDQISEYEGRWHLDSLKDQFKSVLFLTQTTEDSGPFEFIPGTQKSTFKGKQLIQGKLITLKDLLNGTRAYQKLADQHISELMKKNPSMRVIVPPGSYVFVNTSAIHRAKPCKEHGRYALFSYYK